MPGTTSRGYPYPLDTDPIDVAGDMQKLAEAINTDVIASNEFRRFASKTELDTWTTAPESAMASTADNGGSVWQRRSGAWRRIHVDAWGTSGVSAPTTGGNASMNFLGGTNVVAQDAWGLRVLVEGIYKVTANIIFAGAQGAAQQVVEAGLSLFSWANTTVAKYNVTAFTSGSGGWYKLVTTTAYMGMAADEWLRVPVGGDTPSQQVDGRSRVFLTRVDGVFP